MELTVGTILEGKVKTITNFGAFVALPENKTGMVHISEVANAYVSDIRAHLTEGQDVKVVVIGNENGKINLSIKRLEPKPQREKCGSCSSGWFPPRSKQWPPPRRQSRPGSEPSPVRNSRTCSCTQDCRPAVRGEAEGIHVRIRYQAVLHPGRSSDQEQKKIR